MTLTPPPGSTLASPSSAYPPALVKRIGTMRVKAGRYHDGERSYQRTSNLLKLIETETFHLDEWKANMLAVGLSMRSDLVLGVAAAAQFGADGKLTAEAKSALSGLRYQAMAAAKDKAGANRGTAVHTATERLDLGETVDQIALPYPYNADLAAYELTKRTMGLRFRPEHIERSVRNKTTDNVGTFDRIGECDLLVERGVLAPGELLVVDVKTEGAPLRNLLHIGPQLADYAFADDMFVPEPRPETKDDPNGPYAGRYEPMPPVSRVVGLMIHVRDGRAVPYLVNLAEGWEAAQGAAAQRARVARSNIALGNAGCWAVQVPLDLLPATALTQDMAAPALAEARKAAEAVPTGAELVGGSGPMPTAPIPDGPTPLEAMLFEAIVQAQDAETLADLFDRAAATGVLWTGPIEQAATRRFGIVRCGQRAMHDPSTTAKCACGWVREDRP